VLAGLFVVSVLDVVLTWLGLELGLIREANPLLAHAFSFDARLTVLLTIIVMAGAVWILNRYERQVWWVKHAVAALLVIRLGVLVLHLPWLVVAVR
jgi:hypothetical protein